MTVLEVRTSIDRLLGDPNIDNATALRHMTEIAEHAAGYADALQASIETDDEFDHLDEGLDDFDLDDDDDYDSDFDSDYDDFDFDFGDDDFDEEE